MGLSKIQIEMKPISVPKVSSHPITGPIAASVLCNYVHSFILVTVMFQEHCQLNVN